jgi:hypothetical protein
LSGRRAYEGETISDVLARVIEREPDWSALPSATPARLRELLRRCLKKDPRARLRDIGEARVRWRADGRELFFIAPEAKLMAASVRTSSSSPELGSPTTLFQTRIVTASTLKQEYAVSADGRFLVNTVFDDVASPITLLLNWKPPAK